MSMLLIEPIGDKPVRLVGKGLNAAIVLKPGEPQEIEAALGAKLLKQCSKNIRVSRSQWMSSWQELASMTEGIAAEHPRLKPLQKALGTCDKAFAQDDWSAFQCTFETIRQLTKDVVNPPKPTQVDGGATPQLKPGDQIVYRTPPIRIGEKVSYRTPVIKTPTNYSWAWHHGIVKEISEALEMVIIIPSDTPQKLISIPFVYFRPYEKNEINEIMEVGEHGQEDHS